MSLQFTVASASGSVIVPLDMLISLEDAVRRRLGMNLIQLAGAADAGRIAPIDMLRILADNDEFMLPEPQARLELERNVQAWRAKQAPTLVLPGVLLQQAATGDDPGISEHVISFGA